MRRSLLLLILASTLGMLSASGNGGLNYSYYEGNWSAMPDFSSLTAIKTGTIQNVDLGIRGRDNYFSVLWQGFITIPADGIYTFELNSDDGSKMYLGNYNSASTPLINNDGLHGSKTVTASQYLYKGVFPIALAYFQGTGGNLMEFYWSSNTGLARQKVPDNALSSNYIGSVSSYSGLNYSYTEGAYNALPDFMNQSKLKTGNSANIDLSPRNKNLQYAFLWEGYITVPADGTYTFETNSDDGSKVYIGSYNNGLSPLVNNDGNHGSQIRKGIIYLSAGVYPIAISFYQNSGDQIMELYWSSNTGINRQVIPDNAFKSTANVVVTPPVTTPIVTNGPINYSYYEGGYSSLPDVTSLTAVKTGTSSTFDLGVRNREVQYVMMWQTNITLPATGLYTFETNSDDGSKLYLGAFNNSVTPLVNNDGLHGTQIRTGSIQLSAGLYTLTIVYFQNTGGQAMEAYWSNNVGLARQQIPTSVMSAVNTVAAPVITPVTPVPPLIVTPAPAPDLSESTESAGLTGLHNYYFSSTTGDDSRSSTQAQNSSTPWKSLDKLNSLLPFLQTGDAVLLKRGDVFNGSIKAIKSGIIFSAYGVGYKPVINGFTTLGNWVNLGGGVYSSYYPYSGSRINVLTINGTEEEMGRYPNASDPKKGYLTYDSHTFNNSNLTGSITDNDFSNSNSVNWTGAELAIRKCRWIIDKCPITYQGGNTFYYNSPTAYYGIDGFGYFIQNHPKTLDQFGEWYYDPNSKNMQVYFGSYNPNNFTTKESVVDVLVSMTGVSNITFDNIAFEGANTKAFEFGSCSNITIANCNISYTGKTGINANYTSGLNISNCVIRNTNNTAIYLGPEVSYSTISNNKIINTGLFPGMGESNTDARTAFAIGGNNNVIQYNEIDSTGHAGIKFTGNNSTVKNNLVNYFCLTSDDAAGIYTHDNGFTGRSIVNNVVINGVGASDGTNSNLDYAAQGIGLDDFSTNVEITGNSIANCNGRGLGIHNSHELSITGNTAYNNDMAQMEFDHDVIGPNDPIRNATLTNNIFVSKRADQDVFIIRTLKDDVGSFGVANNNVYARPIDDKLTFNMFTYFGTSNQIQKQYDLSHWKSSFGYDANSVKSPVSIAPYAVNSTSANTYANSTFDSNIKLVLNAASDRSYYAWDNTVLDGGALRVNYTGGSSSIIAVWFYDPSSNITLLAGHTYRVKFSVKGNVDNNIDFYGAFQSASANVKSESKTFKIYNTRGEVELLFTPSVNVPASYFAISTANANLCPTWWLDNLTMQEVYSISYTNPDDYLRFEYNATTSNKTIALDGVYSDMKSNIYNYAITLAPYTSAVLVKKGSSIVSETTNTLSSEAATAGKIQTVTAEVAPKDNVAAMDLKVTPNPAVNMIRLTLAVPQTDVRKGTLTIYSASGAVVNAKEIAVSNQPLTVDVSTLAKGVYTVNVVIGKNIISRKFVKL